jgi:hypothetical protein
MDISTLTLKLIILLFPGLIAALIYRRLTIKHKERSDFMFTLIGITEGVTAYLIVQILSFIWISIHNCFSEKVLGYDAIHAFKDLSNTSVIPYPEIIIAGFIAIGLGLLTAKISHDNLLNKVAMKMGITNKYGDENLFSNFLNDDETQWIYVKDVTNKLTYLGAIHLFSETSDFKELVLNDVTVFTYPESEELYEVKQAYLCLPKDKIIIEQAILNSTT